jgi:hypothetical protein
MFIKTNFLVILFISFFIFFNGCGKKESTPGGEQTQDVKKDVSKDDATKKDEQKKENKSNELGIAEGMPKDYPSDIPQPKNAKCLGYLSTSEGTVVTFESDEKPDDILAQFKTDLPKNGFKQEEGEMMTQDGGLALWKKDARECSLMIARDKEKNKTSIVVTYK